MTNESEKKVRLAIFNVHGAKTQKTLRKLVEDLASEATSWGAGRDVRETVNSGLYEIITHRGIIAYDKASIRVVDSQIWVGKYAAQTIEASLREAKLAYTLGYVEMDPEAARKIRASPLDLTGKVEVTYNPLK